MKVLVTGATGQLGAYVMERLAGSPFEVVGLGGRTGGRVAGIEARPFDLTDADGLGRLLDEIEPDVVLHLAAVSRAEDAFRDPVTARRVNITSTDRLARWAAGHGARLVFTSTDLVFDGILGDFDEQEPTGPVLEYGRTKEAAEVVAEGSPEVLITRLSLLYGPSRNGRPTFLDSAMEDLKKGQSRRFFEDEFRTPLDYRTAADVLVQLLDRRDVTGVLHVGGPERMSRFGLMSRCVETMGLDASLVLANRMADARFDEPRPKDVSLNTDRLRGVMPRLTRPSVEDAIRLMTNGDG